MKATYLLPLAVVILIVIFFAGLPALRDCPPPKKLADDRRGWRSHWFILALTLVYTVVAFVNLGDTRAPQSFRQLQSEYADIELEQPSPIGRVMLYTGIVQGSYAIRFSPDGETWLDAASFEQNHAALLKWQEPDMSAAPEGVMRAVRIVGYDGVELGEVALFSPEGELLRVSCGVTEFCDEQALVPDTPYYLNSSYFDEIYHARTAWEHLRGMYPYEISHPPLGKEILSLGILLFGMTPFGWRFAGAMAGVLMLPGMYLLGKLVTRRRITAFAAMFLMAVDFMHYTQTRIATIDSYAVFWIMLMYLFMFRYSQMSWNRDGLGRTLVPLGLCGVTMGIAWATKWIGLYASAGLAVIFFWTVFRRVREIAHVQDKARCLKNLLYTLLFCLVFFVVVPVVIYYFSYYWLLKGEGLQRFGEMFSGKWVSWVIQQQKNIFGYHAGLGGDTHYFRSPWYQWPIIWWPMWYYSGTGYMPEGTISSISCMGNPAVWWFGLAALLFTVWRVCWNRRAHRADLLVVIGFASQFLPWVIVPRSTFIYHYFASVPFIILASALMLDAIRKKSETAFNVTAGALLGSSLILFGAFYPLESGLPCPRSYAQHLRWFKWYNY